MLSEDAFQQLGCTAFSVLFCSGEVSNAFCAQHSCQFLPGRVIRTGHRRRQLVNALAYTIYKSGLCRGQTDQSGIFHYSCHHFMHSLPQRTVYAQIRHHFRSSSRHRFFHILFRAQSELGHAFSESPVWISSAHTRHSGNKSKIVQTDHCANLSALFAYYK